MGAVVRHGLDGLRGQVDAELLAEPGQEQLPAGLHRQPGMACVVLVELTIGVVLTEKEGDPVQVTGRHPGGLQAELDGRAGEPGGVLDPVQAFLSTPATTSPSRISTAAASW